jgi:hypothetical protein
MIALQWPSHRTRAILFIVLSHSGQSDNRSAKGHINWGQCNTGDTNAVDWKAKKRAQQAKARKRRNIGDGDYDTSVIYVLFFSP